MAKDCDPPHGRSRIFLRWGANSQSGCTNLLFCEFFAKNCMKMKQFGPRGDHVNGAPPWIRQCPLPTQKKPWIGPI